MCAERYEAYTAAMAYAMGYVEGGVDDSKWIAEQAAAYYDGYAAALENK